MGNRVFKVQGAPQIMINGHAFTLLKNEAEIMKAMQEIRDMAQALSAKEKPTPEEILGACRMVEAFIDGLCGKGAMYTMVDGAVMRVRETMDLAVVIEEEAMKAYAGALIKKYE